MLNRCVLAGVTLLLAWAAHAQHLPRLNAVKILDTRDLTGTEIPGSKAREISGLAWHAGQSRLYAVSDRGVLFSYAMDVDEGRIAALLPLSARVISGGGLKPNAESLTLRRGRAGLLSAWELVMSDERSVDALVTDLEGRLSSKEALPHPLLAKEQWHDLNSGVEALSWHLTEGLLAAPQRPLRGTARGIHRIYATSGRIWAFKAHQPARSSVKAIEVLDGNRLLVLEKVNLAKGHLTVLRELSLDSCTPAQPCDAPAVELDDPRIQPDDNFEGLTCLDAHRCLLVTDSGNASSGRTLLALVRLERR